MPQSSVGSHHSGRRRYRTRAITSQVDEALFGTPKLQSPCDTKQSETRGNSETRARNAPAQKTQQEETIRIITNDLIRDLKIPSQDPSGLSVILSAAEMKRITSASRVTSKEEREAAREALQEKREATMDAVEERKALIRQADLLRKKNQALTEMEAEARDRAQYLLERANAMRMEQEDEVRKLNELILGAQCHAVRDAQILEKQQILAELMGEERRLDDMMELDRRRALQAQDQIEELRKQQRIQGEQQMKVQIEERLKEKLLQEELKEQEGQQLLEKLETMEMEELRSLVRKKEEQQILQEEIVRINAESLRAKERKLEEERMADIRAMEFTRKKMEREAEYEAEQTRVKREKEREVARLRALQERDRDHRAEQDELRARRNQEAADREWRRKEKEQAKRKAKEEAMLKAALSEQVVRKEHLLSIEAGRERAEFERVLKAQQEAIAKQRDNEERQRQKALRLAAGVRQQVREREQAAVAKRRETFEEGDRLAEEARQRRARLDEMEEKKLRELRAAGLPEKYCNQVERKVPTLKHCK